MANTLIFVTGRRALFVWLMAAMCSALAADIQAGRQKSESTPSRQNRIMKIRMMVDGTVTATATLDNNESARQFAALLPLDLALKDYAATEKVADLPGRLSTQGAPDGYKPSAGDIAYYAPWGNLAIFHKDFEFSSGLVRLGRLDSGLDAMRRPGPMSVRVELSTP
jgi:hypothetical protein